MSLTNGVTAAVQRADGVQATHRATQARSGAGSLAGVSTRSRRRMPKRARAAMTELIRLAIMDTPIKQRAEAAGRRASIARRQLLNRWLSRLAARPARLAYKFV